MDISNDLNEQQRVAVETTEGPVLILAGAGSGKTKALTHRIAYLIKEKSVDPSNILAVTFTNKAAKEMASRVAKLLSNEYRVGVLSRENENGDGTSSKHHSKLKLNTQNLPMMGTFHSICVKILRKEIEVLGYGKNFTIYDEHDSLTAVKKAMAGLEIDIKKYSPKAIKGIISSAKNELLNAKEYQKIANGYFQEIASKIYFRYDEILRNSQALDFDDLIMKCVEIFQNHSEALKKYQELFRYIHIDEYQDTNHAQYKWAELLAEKYRNIFVIGDDFQAIYSWRGANFQNILDFERDYPDTKVIKLEQNYRSTKTILDAANSIIEKNERRSKKILWTENGGGELITIYEARDEKDEARFIVMEIEDLVRDGLGLKDFVVLYRTNAQSRSLEEAFIRQNLPYKIIGGVRFYQRKEIKDILAYLKIVESGKDEISFDRILNTPVRGIGEASQIAFRNFAKNGGFGFLEAISHIDEAEGISHQAKRGLKDLQKIIYDLREKKDNLQLPNLIEYIMKRSGYFSFLDTLTEKSVEGIEGEVRKENLKELLSVAYEFSNGKHDYFLTDFLEEVALISDIDNYSLDAEAVTLMTLHNAKGLEFKIVFMAGMEEGLFPHNLTMMDKAEMEEERRLCYVGVTRAMEKLYLLHASKRLIWGDKRYSTPSRFLNDIPAHLTDGALDGHFDNLDDESIDNIFVSEFKASDRVSHDKFGEGTVISANGSEIEIEFLDGEKRLIDLEYIRACLKSHRKKIERNKLVG